MQWVYRAMVGLCLMSWLMALAAPSEKVNTAAPKRDPFATSDRMYAEQAMQTSLRQAQPGFVPGMVQGQGLPKMKLKGYTTKHQGKATALLEIEGAGVYMVKKGDEIGLHAIGHSTVLKVIEVSANGVKVQSGQVNQVVIVR